MFVCDTIILLFTVIANFVLSLFTQDAADNDLSDQEELDLENEDEDDDKVDELALSFNDVEVHHIFLTLLHLSI